jgi:HAD superfamily hydrolase (TIGR01549 family)
VGALIVVFDLDGTLLDSDAALLRPFVALGIPPEDVRFGAVVGDECRRLGVDLDRYVALYDTTEAQPFPGVEAMLARLERWAVCSNKDPRSGRAELARLGWEPEVALFTDAFDGPKHLHPVLDALGAAPAEVVFVGDTDHDRSAARDAQVRFALAGWNPRAVPADGDTVLDTPGDVLRLRAP